MAIGAPSEDDLLTIPEAAATLKVSPVTISRWLKQGRLTAYRLGPRAVRIHRNDLTDVLKPSGHALAGDVATGGADPIADDSATLLVSNGKPAVSQADRLSALAEAADLRERILTRRKGVQLPALEAERGKEKRGKRS